jgi:hypothetical protein
VLYSRYLFPFEITSLVLLVAMVGADRDQQGAAAAPTRRAARAAQAGARRRQRPRPDGPA